MLADVHTHLLPEIDDGARDVQMSLDMLDMLAADGVTDVMLTPHFYLQNQTVASFLSKRSAAYERLCAHGPGNIKFHLGAEVEFSNVSINYKQFRNLGIDGGRYILLELPYLGDLDKTILPKLDQLIYQTGMQPIIAHIERYQGIHRKPWLAAELINMGCLLQINADAALESRRGTLTDALFQHGQVHLLGTDCHNTTTRRPNLLLALERIEDQYGKACRNYLTGTAEAVTHGIRVRASADSQIRKRFGKYR